MVGDAASSQPVAVQDQWVTRWLSAARFAVYVDAAAGNRALAFDLYE